MRFVTSMLVIAACLSLTGVASGAEYYCDPVNGLNNNPGTKELPWPAIGEMMMVNRNFHKLVKSGDTVYLTTGDHQMINVQNIVNTDYITIQAATGHKPVVRYVWLQKTNKWKLRGLTIRNPIGFTNNQYLVSIRPCEDVAFTHCTVYSQDEDADQWSSADWLAKASSGIIFEVNRGTLSDNIVRDVKTAIIVGGSEIVCERNTVDHFWWDGIDFYFGDSVLRSNVVTNHFSIEGRLEHFDCFQGWALDGIPRKNVVIDSNVAIQSTGSHPKIPLTSLGTYSDGLQGISIFDGEWQNLTVTRNYAKVASWHGISMYGINGGTVSGNTLHQFPATDPKQLTWLTIQPRKGGVPAQNVLVKGNVANRFLGDSDQISYVNNVSLIYEAKPWTTDLGNIYLIAP